MNLFNDFLDDDGIKMGFVYLSCLYLFFIQEKSRRIWLN